MQYKNFEDHVRTVFGKDVEPVDTAALLGALDLPTASASRRLPLWLMLGLALLVIGSLSFVMFGDKADEVANNQTSRQVDLKNATVAATALVADETSTQKVILPTTQAFAAETETVNTIQAEVSLSEKKTTATTSYARTPAITTENSSRAKAFAEIEKQEVLIREEEKSAADVAATSVDRSYDVATTTNASVTERSLLTTPPALEGLGLGGVENTSSYAIKAPTDKIKCPTFGPSGGNFSFAVIPEIGAMLANENIEGVPTDPTSMIRMQDERALEGLQAGLYLKASHSKIPVYLRSGLSYSRVSHRLPLSYERVERDTTQGIISITTSTTGDTITAIMGDIITETTITGQSTKHYYTHQWDVPVAVGIEQAFGRWIVGLEAGVNVNVRTTASGNILRTPSEFGPVEGEIDINRRVGLGYFGGVQVGRDIEGFGEVYLAARARSIPDISSVTTSTTQRYMLYGLHAGYVYRF